MSGCHLFVGIVLLMFFAFGCLIPTVIVIFVDESERSEREVKEAATLQDFSGSQIFYNPF